MCSLSPQLAQTLRELIRATCASFGGPQLAGLTVWIYWYDQPHVSLRVGLSGLTAMLCGHLLGALIVIPLSSCSFAAVLLFIRIVHASPIYLFPFLLNGIWRPLAGFSFASCVQHEAAEMSSPHKRSTGSFILCARNSRILFARVREYSALQGFSS